MGKAEQESRFYCRVSSKGQVTLPVELRHALGIVPKRYVEVQAVDQGDEIVIQVRPHRSGIERFYRSIKPVEPTPKRWEDVEREAKEQRADHIVDEMGHGQ